MRLLCAALLVVFVTIAGLGLSVSSVNAQEEAEQSEEKDKKKKESTIQQAKGCPNVKPAKIEIFEYTGNLYQNQEKDAFGLAREKSKKYDRKMPLRIGNMGEVAFRTEMFINIKTSQNMGCIYIEYIDAKIFVDHKIEIANDFADGSCMYNELYNLEIELMQQDEEIINKDMHAFREEMHETVGKNNVYGPYHGASIADAVVGKRAEIKNMIDMRLGELGRRLFELRKKTDLPDYYTEIQNECMGG